MANRSLADELNRSCHCISVDPQVLQHSLEARFGEPGSYTRLLETHPSLLASDPVFIAREHIEQMQSVIDATERVVALPLFQENVLARAPGIATAPAGASGVFFGYDFHLTNDGPRLIEINTNAGGALLLLHVAAAQQACCAEVDRFIAGAQDTADLEQTFIDMFREEFAAASPGGELRCVAIVDEDPQSQYLAPEFELFRTLFLAHGIDAVIADPADFRIADGRLTADGRSVDLVYNRLTDFYLQSDACAVLRRAYLDRIAVCTPAPRLHALYASKRNLTILSDPVTLHEVGADRTDVETLSAAVPNTVDVSSDNAEALWQRRKGLFFKPVWGFGSRGTYKGAKLTRKTWEAITGGGYIAQELIPPSERLLLDGDTRRSMKVDVRCYVYKGGIQLLGARMYRGQTTNFRTDGGGLSAVFTTPPP